MIRDRSLLALLASYAALGTGPPLWVLVPRLSLAVVAVALAVIGASVPLINAPYIGMLTMRVPPALRGHVLQSLITINQVLGPLGYVLAVAPMRGTVAQEAA